MCLKNTFSYLKLCNRFYSYYKYFNNYSEHNMVLLDALIESINDCGAVMIKFCQWITPKLELMYLDNENLINENKPTWLQKLESFYENCENHSLTYTKDEYEKIFNEPLDDVYLIHQIIGSGSIGQVYLVTNKSTNEKQVMKILHPNVKQDIHYFRKFMKFLFLFPCIKNKILSHFPFDIFEFINQFNDQTNFINESNNLLHFQKEYNNNSLIIIPTLIKCSSSIMIMSYEEGISLDKSDLNDYHKDKIVNLYHLFIRNNQMIKNFNHGDLHPGNWKIKIDSNKNHKLIFYDFGFCWKIPDQLFIEVGTIFYDTFEESNNDLVSSKNNLYKLMFFSILHNFKNETNKDRLENECKEKIRIHVDQELEKRKGFDVLDSLKATITFCVHENLLLDPTLIQCYIIFIQGQKLFEKYGLMTSEQQEISDYEVYREKYLNILTFCKTNDIFQEHTTYIETKLNKKQLKVNTIFDTIELPDSIKELALSK
jgi:predicted unusual protein kinase regulating ubiquinone biosynthesis (AarF/ABC1/UbiB family)